MRCRRSPLLGATKGTQPFSKPYLSDIQRSCYLTDGAITDMSRCFSMVRNSRFRYRRSPRIEVSIFRDSNTPWPFRDPLIRHGGQDGCEIETACELVVNEGSVHLDTMMFGGGCCGLQATMQLRNVSEARKLHDQLIPLAPIMLALSAATPIWKGS